MAMLMLAVFEIVEGVGGGFNSRPRYRIYPHCQNSHKQIISLHNPEQKGKNMIIYCHAMVFSLYHWLKNRNMREGFDQCTELRYWPCLSEEYIEPRDN